MTRITVALLQQQLTASQTELTALQARTTALEMVVTQLTFERNLYKRQLELFEKHNVVMSSGNARLADALAHAIGDLVPAGK
ncbi:hypothetical protein LCGC14_2422030 [marine sediment metagenome]|uniref:Uncharacterized protein n=1 Tax=marine sediment metagenome TaxID=412755 RepID=A0A0F9BPG5_9ZZZZ